MALPSARLLWLPGLVQDQALSDLDMSRVGSRGGVRRNLTVTGNRAEYEVGEPYLV